MYTHINRIVIKDVETVKGLLRPLRQRSRVSGPYIDQFSFDIFQKFDSIFSIHLKNKRQDKNIAYIVSFSCICVILSNYSIFQFMFRLSLKYARLSRCPYRVVEREREDRREKVSLSNPFYTVTVYIYIGKGLKSNLNY
jgi:hypothetical protein